MFLTARQMVACLIHLCYFIRFPFYWEIKTLVLLFLSLPQIQVKLDPAEIRILSLTNFVEGINFCLRCISCTRCVETRSTIGSTHRFSSDELGCLGARPHFCVVGLCVQGARQSSYAGQCNRRTRPTVGSAAHRHARSNGSSLGTVEVVWLPHPFASL